MLQKSLLLDGGGGTFPVSDHSDVLNITMHTEVVIHLMNAYVRCWSKICGSLDEILSLTMGSYESKILNKF